MRKLNRIRAGSVTSALKQIMTLKLLWVGLFAVRRGKKKEVFYFNNLCDLIRIDR